VRGICCLRPGVPGVSDNIRVFSIVGRFLEHERMFLVGTPGDEQLFLSSADWMPRNLLRRVEVMFPVDVPALREQLRRESIEPALADNSHAYDMRADGSYVRRTPPAGEAPRVAQAIVLERTVGAAATPEPLPEAPAPAREPRPRGARSAKGAPAELI